MGRYSINDNIEKDPNPFPTLGAFDLHSRAQNATIGATHTFSAHWIADGRISYYRSIFLFGATLPGTNFNQQAGVQGFNDLTSLYSFPQITMTNYATFTGSPSDQRPKSNRIRNWQSAANLSYASGPPLRQDRRGFHAPDRRLLQRLPLGRHLQFRRDLHRQRVRRLPHRLSRLRDARLLQGIERRLRDLLELLRPGQLPPHAEPHRELRRCASSSIRSTPAFAARRARSISPPAS